MSTIRESPDITVSYTLKIEASVESSGDYMRNSSLEEFLKWAQEDSRYLKVLVQRGNGEPKVVPAKITLDKVLVASRSK